MSGRDVQDGAERLPLKRIIGAGLVLLLLASCTTERRGAFEGFRDLDPDEVITYRLKIGQTREARGLGVRKELPSRVQIDLEEEATSDESYDIVVRDSVGKGEQSQRVAAQRLKGRRLSIDLDDGEVAGDAEAFSGTQDVAASDIAMMYVLFAPLVPSPRVEEGETWRTRTQPIDVPWSTQPLRFSVTHEAIALDELRELDVARVKSVALGNVRFRMPLLVPREGGSATPDASDDLIVNQLFESLFSDIDHPVEGVAAAIAAIPLAIVAPFLAIGEAIGNIFGGSSSSSQSDEPQIPIIDMSGPIELRADSNVWLTDGRVLDGLGNGTMQLTGRLPELPGEASDLSGKTITIDVRWRFTRTLTSPWPEPRDPPGRGWLPVIAMLFVVVAFVAALMRFPPWRSRRTRRSDTLPAPTTPPKVHA